MAAGSIAQHTGSFKTEGLRQALDCIPARVVRPKTMLAPDKPADEEQRLAALHALNLLDTPPEERFDRLTRLARRLFGVPIALVSLIDEKRQWFKSCMGLPVQETPRELAFCAYTILGDGVFVVPDLAADTRFADHPQVAGEPHLRFYAGCPLRTPDGYKIGTLCLLDTAPRTLSDDDHDLLRDLAGMAEQELVAAQLASTDELTGLSNRRGFRALATHSLRVCSRQKWPVVMLSIDLDGLEPVNDRFGHATGDALLRGTAQALLATFRESDVIGRIGGDEFAVLLANISDSQCDEALGRMHKNLAAQRKPLPAAAAIGCSIGRMRYDPARHESVDALLAEADAARPTRVRQSDPAG